MYFLGNWIQRENKTTKFGLSWKKKCAGKRIYEWYSDPQKN